MLPRRDQNNLQPMSRVSSSTRLTQNVSPGNFPSTPTNYQVSSLNPIRASSRSVQPKTAQELEFETKFNALEGLHVVQQFESHLADLSSKVGLYDGDDLQETIDALIKTNQSLRVEMQQLKKHKQLGETIKSLEDDKKGLVAKSTNILKQLIEFRTELKKLPSLPTRQVEPSSTYGELNVEEILKYGMKLSKFTKAPPSSNGGAMQIHPNNFIWPAEDSLRRGTLAICSLKYDDIIRNELGADKTSDVGVPEADELDDSNAMEIDHEDIKKVDNKRPRQKKPQPEAAPAAPAAPAALDLDLFDPDNEDDSD